jgi:hypothetical protein
MGRKEIEKRKGKIESGRKIKKLTNTWRTGE